MMFIPLYISHMGYNDEKLTKKVTGVRLDPALVKELKILAVNLDRSVTSLLEESAKMVLEKYKAVK